MPRRPAVPGIALVLLLHLVLLWLVLRPAYQPVARDHRTWLQLWQPAVKLTPSPPAVVSALRVPAAALAQPAMAPALPPLDAAAALPSPAPAATADTPEVQALLAEPAPAKSLPADVVPADVVRQALKDVAAIDRQLRAEHPQALTPPPGSPNARLARGIAAAGAAVKPKWFEQARIELFSAPNDPKRIYRVITAMGEYCLFYPDTGSIAFNSAPKSGWAGAGQPTMSDCPTRF
jgi:hypothetical protein